MIYALPPGGAFRKIETMTAKTFSEFLDKAAAGKTSHGSRGTETS